MSRHWGPNYHDTLEPVKKIGQGGEGSAFLVRRTTNNRLLVCKVATRFIRWKDTDHPREAKILLQIIRNHPRILKMLHFEITHREHFMAFYDYYAGGDLRAMMVEEHGGVRTRVLWHVFLQMAEALAFLHYGFTEIGIAPPRGWRHIIHCDLKVCLSPTSAITRCRREFIEWSKRDQFSFILLATELMSMLTKVVSQPENIFLKTPYSKEHPLPDLVLGDFGFANAEKLGQSEEGGTWAYMPPEYPVSSQWGDVWALGCTIHALVHGETPLKPKPENFPGGDGAWVRDPSSRDPQPFPETYKCHELNDSMMQCLRRTWNHRPQSDNLLINLRFDFEMTKAGS